MKLRELISRFFFQAFDSNIILANAPEANALAKIIPGSNGCFFVEEIIIFGSIVVKQSSVTTKSSLVIPRPKKTIIYTYISFDFGTQMLIFEQCSSFSHIF